jgi:predicted Zn-dependent protease
MMRKAVINLMRYIFSVMVVTVFSFLYVENKVLAAYGKHNTSPPAQNQNAGFVYPQFRRPDGQVVHWLAEQMPLKVYVAPGQTVEKIVDPSLGDFNVDNVSNWPDLVAQIIENQQLSQLPIAEGYVPEHYQAAIAGISSWKQFEKEGLFSFEFTNDPTDADIYFFWVNHFTDKHGFGLLANDIRGDTAKYMNWYRAILESKPVKFKPVVSLLRTTNQQGNPMALPQMQASAAHEFGHALGIDQHSTNPRDLMSLYYGNGRISPNDAATIRYLYHLTPDLVP